MEAKKNVQDADQGSAPEAPAPKKTKLIMLLLCILIIAAGAFGANYLVSTAPKANRQPPAKMSPLVQVMHVQPQEETIVIHAAGTVIPARELTLKSRVAGEIVAIHPEFGEGGIVHKGDLVLQIDDQDYKLLLAQKQSAVVEARYALKLELGKQDVAQREWALLNGDSAADPADADLALRRPHLEKARSDVAAAEAELEQARLQLERTRILAPFNALILGTNVERGSQVASQESLATLVGIDEYHVQVSIPVDRLQWITIPRHNSNPGARARIVYQGDAEREGTVIKLLGDLESEGRMARLLLAVEDPLELARPKTARPPMLIGEYVRVAIQGRRIEQAYRIPRSALRENTRIWVAASDDTLQIRDIEPLWRGAETVLLNEGLKPGDRLIVSDLAAPVAGMPVEIEAPAPSSMPATAQPQGQNQG
jgi:RND family efflux transporter MFP subunit